MSQKELLTMAETDKESEFPEEIRYPQAAHPYPVIYQPPPLPDIRLEFSDVRQFIAPPNCTDDEVRAFILICQACHLDPWKNEIYLAKPGGNAVTITGYRSYLDRAERTGLVEYWDAVCDDDDNPTRATYICKRRDWSREFRWTVLRKEVAFVQSRDGMKERAMHRSQPSFQLKKCAISQGSRLLFPSECGSLPYIPEELPQTENLTSEAAANGDARFSQKTGKPEGPIAGEPEKGQKPEPPAFDYDYWRARYFASFAPDKKTGEIKFPHVRTFFQDEGNRHNWQAELFPDRPSLTDWDSEEYFTKAIGALPSLEDELSRKDVGLPDQILTLAGESGFTPDSFALYLRTHYQSCTTNGDGLPVATGQQVSEVKDLSTDQQIALLEELKKIKPVFQAIRDVASRTGSLDNLVFYLKCRYTAPFAGASDDIRTLLARAIGDNKVLTRLREAVKMHIEWAEWVGGVEEVESFISTVYEFLIQLDDPNIGVKVMDGFFKRMEVKPVGGLYRLADIKPDHWETWQIEFASAVAESGSPIQFTPPIGEKEPESQIAGEPEAIDDTPF